jgi:ferredoxin
MTYIVNGNCVKCRYTDCVVVCPVDCFLAGPNMLVINPDECIDCGVCEPECPADAIRSDSNITPELEWWRDKNKELTAIYKPITRKESAPEDADHWNPKLNTTIGDKKDLI